jgi:two-component system LytT family response regulator
MQIATTSTFGPSQILTNPGPSAPNAQALTAPAGPSKIRTLIVDDDPVARDVLRRLLQKEPDLDVVGVTGSSRQAVDLINQLTPDLVFMDIQMPELDGFGVLGRVTCPHPPTIIFVTANDTFAEQAADAHALDFVVKPCSRQRLQAALQRVRQARAAIRP